MARAAKPKNASLLNPRVQKYGMPSLLYRAWIAFCRFPYV